MRLTREGVIAAMPIDETLDDLLALPIESAARLARVSVRRVRYWDERRLVTPSIKRRLNSRNTVRLYSFGDLVELMAVALLRHERISLQEISKIVDHLHAQDYAAPLRDLRYATYAGEVYFQHPDGSWEGGRKPGQLVIVKVLPLTEIATEIHNRAGRREETAAGRIVRRRRVHGHKPVFEGTRIPVQAVIDYLERGYTTERILEAFPSLTAADVAAARATIDAA
jgi:uncharacterized protein (DUF433 family)